MCKWTTLHQELPWTVSTRFIVMMAALAVLPSATAPDAATEALRKP
jgi:hypothetical protein